jgi:four helix bundle protein
MEQKERSFDLENRLVKFACLCLDVCDILPNNIIGQILLKQLARSSTSPALNYGEVLGAESKADFIHKMSIVLKELRETNVNLRIINEKPIIKNGLTQTALNEFKELVAIFTKSLETVRKSLTEKVTK